MSESEQAPLGRGEAFERLRTGLATVAALADRVEGAPDDRERRSALLMLVTAAWHVRDQAADAYAALERGRDEGGLARGVLE